MQDEGPLVSVIIPVYNGAKYLAECLECVLSQSYSNLEVILVDDGSSDETKSIVADYPNINYIFQKNKGLASARNTGIGKAKGDYVFFIDSDDILLNNSIKELVNEASNDPSVDVIYGKAMHFHGIDSQEFYIKYDYHRSNVFYDLLKYGNFIVIGTVLVKTGVFKKHEFDANYRRSEDFDFWLQLAYAGKKFKYVNKCLVRIRIHDMNLSKNIQAMMMARSLVLEKWLGITSKNKKALSAVLIAKAKSLLIQKMYLECLRDLFAGLVLNVFNWQEVVVQFIKMILIVSGIYGGILRRKISVY